MGGWGVGGGGGGGGGSGFATDRPWGVLCPGLNTCPQYVSPVSGNLVVNKVDRHVCHRGNMSAMFLIRFFRIY